MRRLQISIPTGTIKSPIKDERVLFVPVFQFLLVRLKRKARPQKANRLLISIPTGTIKRFNAFHIVVYFIVHFNSY